MSLLAKIFSESVAFEGVVIFLIGTLFGSLLFYWKQRNFETALQVKEKETIEKARKEAEGILREARVSANEDSLKQRDEMERQLSERRKELAATEKRMVERETLLNQQLENLVQ